MKKVLVYLLAIVTVCTMITAFSHSFGMVNEDDMASVASLNIGDYILLGKYDGIPVLWHYVADDENGRLMLSDKVLCFKNSGKSNLWAETLLRKWLNSNVPEGEVEWGYVTSYNTFDVRTEFDRRGNQFDWEKGFLNEDNFSHSERTVMKRVVQWTMLPKDHLDLSKNGETEAFSPIKGWTPYMGMTDPSFPIFCDISELPDYYIGAAHQLEDTMFLLDEMQVYRIWSNFGNSYDSLATISTTNAWITPQYSYKCGYALRTSGSGINYYGKYQDSSSPHGIRPAFYLDEANAVILSGNGTEDDPYVISGKTDNCGDNNIENNNTEGKKKDGISVFCNGLELNFDVSPIIENDRTLVPFRTIFEALGAEVSWDEVTQTVTGILNETTIQLTIGSETAYINQQPIPLDVPSRIVNDRTLVPLRFIAENFGFNVDWDEEEQLISIIM